MQSKEILIDSRIQIIGSINKELIGITGKVIEETKNMIAIETAKGIKKLIKNQIKIKKI